MHTLTQYGDIASLLAGAMTGTIKLVELLSYGDTGIGTLDGSDGEMIILDGVAYHAASTGTIRKLEGSELVPYSALTHFDEKAALTLQVKGGAENLLESLLTNVKHAHHFMAVKLHGTFAKVKVRAVPKQEPPYELFSKIEAPEWELDNVSGTLVGFYTPAQYEGVSVKGFHLHFLTDDKSQGGHVIDFDLQEGALEVNIEDVFQQIFPTSDEWANLEFDRDALIEEIHVSE